MSKLNIPLNLHLFDGELGGQADTQGVSVPSQTDISGENNSSAAENNASETVDPQQVEQERKAKFEEFIKEHKDLMHERTQEIINKRFKETKEQEKALKQYARLTGEMAKRYGTTDVEGLLQAYLTDSAILQDEAEQSGMDIDDFLKVKQKERELSEKDVQIESLMQQIVDSQSDKTAAIWDKELKELLVNYPQYEYDDVVSNQKFISELMVEGNTVEDAFVTAYAKDLINAKAVQTAQSVKDAITKNVQTRGMRPSEIGATGASGFAPVLKDVTELTAAERREIAEDAKSGRKSKIVLKKFLGIQ